MSTIIHSKQHHPGHIRQTSADRWAKIIAYIIVGFFGLICLYPLLLTVVVSFTPDETVVKEGYRLIPSQLSLNTYTYLFDQSGGRIAKSYLVTIFITAVGTFGSMLVTCMISYAISLREMKYRNVIRGSFIDRPNRFTAHAEISGRTETVHVKNTGRLRELLLPGAQEGGQSRHPHRYRQQQHGEHKVFYFPFLFHISLRNAARRWASSWRPCWPGTARRSRRWQSRRPR